MKRATAFVLTFAALVATFSTVGASSTDYKYKWPFDWQTSATFTTLPFQQEHGCYGIPATSPLPPYECVAAYDLVIGGGIVRSAHEGTVTVADSTVNTCRSDGGLGTQVWVDNIKYGHLASISGGIGFGTTLLQGDGIGVQGNTGNTLPPTCGIHLHWEFGGIAYGSPLPTIDAGSWGISSNSAIGEYSTPGLTLRTYYTSHGGWNSIGWTTKHCLGTCTLNMTNNLAWGRMQDFQHDPDGYGGTFNTIRVSSWDQTHAYLVDSVFWQAWAAGGPDVKGMVHPIGMAKGERGSCPPGFSQNCLWYQPFDLGFVWMDAFTGRGAVFCADTDGDRAVNTVDMAREAKRFGLPPLPPATLDLDGNNLVDTVDMAYVGHDFGHICIV